MAADLARLTEALFCSCLQPSDKPGDGQVRTVAMNTAACVSEEEIAARVAQEFGDHPETAVARMQWCRRLASAAQLDSEAARGTELCRR